MLLLKAGAGEAEARDQILLIGNSFTLGLKPILLSIIRASGRDASIVARAVSGWTLGDHASSSSTIKRIRSRSWNQVVLQEQSAGIFHSRYDGARALDAEIAAVGANTVFFMTWRDREAPLVAYDSLRGEPGGEVGYVPIAFELGAAVAPAGWAFRESILDDPSVDLWGRDGHHASTRGRTIAALSIFAAIYGENPADLQPKGGGDQEAALRDRILVGNVALDAPDEWNIDAPPGGFQP